MRQDFISPFITAAEYVFRSELEMDLKFCGTEIAGDQVTSKDITVFIGVTGQVEGNVSYGFTNPMARSVLSAMLERQRASMDRIAQSVLGELANLITAQASIGLEAAGYSTRLTPPMLVQPMGRTFTIFGIPQVLVRFETERGLGEKPATNPEGDFPVRVSLRENPRGMAA
jgi:chemotaxis protein CheX